MFLWGFGERIFLNFMTIYLDKQFSLGKSEIGIVFGAYGLAMAITHLPAGRLADRIGRRPLLISARLIGSITTLVMGFALSLPLYLIGLFGYALTAFVSAPLSSYVTAVRGKLSVGTVLTLANAPLFLGMALGPLVGGWIGDIYGMRMTYFAAAVLFVLSTILMFFLETQPVDRHDPKAPPQKLIGNKHLIILTLVTAFALFSMYLAQPLTPNFLTDIRGLSLSEVGLLFTVGAAGNSLMAILFSRVEPRRGFIFAQVLVILFALIIWNTTVLSFFALGYFLLGGYRVSRPMAMAQARDLVHDTQMGVTYGIMETVGAAIIILAPPVAGTLYERDPMIVYPVAIGVMAISTVVSYVFLPRRARRADPSVLQDSLSVTTPE
ncbi:MAG TPA: MFS transporter [Anaerolineales bacterium]|nr:MFS transporter [Anaerolineales bacterium]